MTKIARLNNIENPKDFIDIVKNKELLIYEDVQGSKLFVNFDGENFSLKPKSLRNEPLNFIDLATQKFYNEAYFYFSNLPEYVTKLMGKKWWFCFEYFPDSQPANIKYSRVPKNNLILTCIVKKEKYVYNVEEIEEFSNLLGTEHLPIIFRGKLSENQLNILNLYLNSSEDDLEYVFGEKNFSYFFYKLLNPNCSSSFLMDGTDFNDNLEKISIRVDNNDEYCFDILNPTYQRIKIENTKYLENYSIILLSFLNFCQLVDEDSYKLKSLNKHEAYIEYLSQIYNDYFEQNRKYIDCWDFELPSFFKNDKFKINNLLITNKETNKIISTNDKYEYLLKVVFGSFNKKKKTPFGVFDKQTITLFNNEVKKINKKIETELKINVDYILQKSDVKDFKDFFNIKFNTDLGGNEYPDIYDEMTNDGQVSGSKKKKKKGFDKKINIIEKIPKKQIK